MGRAAGVEVFCWCRGGKDGKGGLGLCCSLHSIWGHFIQKQPRRKLVGITQFQRGVKSLRDVTLFLWCAVAAILGADVLDRERKGFFPQEEPIWCCMTTVLLGKAGWRPGKTWDAAGELQLYRSPFAQRCGQVWQGGYGKPVEVTHPAKFAPKRAEAKFSPFSC